MKGLPVGLGLAVVAVLLVACGAPPTITRDEARDACAQHLLTEAPELRHVRLGEPALLDDSLFSFSGTATDEDESPLAVSCEVTDAGEIVTASWGTR